METALDAVIIMDAQGRVAEWNERAVAMFGWSRAQALGRPMADLIIPERYREQHRRGLKRYLATGKGKILGRRLELSGLRRSGEEFPVELSIAPFEEDGHVYFVGCVRDITARAAMQAAMKESNVQFRILVNAVKEYAIYLLDSEGRITTWNSGAEQIKGYRAKEIIGKNFSRFFTEDDRKAGLPLRILRDATVAGKSQGEGWRVRKDGSRFWASTVIQRIDDEYGKLIGFAKVTRDVTERREAEQLLERARERLLQAQKMEAIGQLTGGVAHDFNNLLMVITGNLGLIQKNLETPGPAADANMRRQVANAMRGAKRGATLTERLLAFSRRQALKPVPLDANKFITSEVEFLQRSLGETVEVAAIGAGGLWQIEVDANQLEAALLNLAVNARDAMANGGKLTIEASNAFLDHEDARGNPAGLPGQYVMISITDTGTGMKRETVERAFEPFFTTKESGQGTGLGLSQVYGFVKQSGGHVKIYSEFGEGTTVKIYLPRFIGDKSEFEPVQPEEQAVGAGETILVVEDDEDVREYLVGALRALNYRVVEAQDAKAALARIERGDGLDLLLTDVVMPGTNGRELARQAQTLRPKLKVLFMTGYSRNAIVHQGRLDPDVELIQKPVTQSELAARIRDFLDGPKPRRAK